MTDDPLNLLLVEDDDVASGACARSLSKHRASCNVVVAEDGVTALSILRGDGPGRFIDRPYVILLDLKMPRMDGFEFPREVRRDARLHYSVMFVLTTSDAEADLERACRENIAGYMVKSDVGRQSGTVPSLLNDYRCAVRLR